MAIDFQALYYQDSYQKEMEAKVLELRPYQEGYALLLDQSCFFPEGGGQPGDTGYLNDIFIQDTILKDGKQYHLSNQKLEPGSKVLGKIDWERRFSLMQHHSAEHLISGICHQLHGYDNVGFHLNTELMTIDFNGYLDQVQVQEIEDRANQAVYENIKIEVLYPSKEGELDYRSKKEIEGQLRLIQIAGYDLCACCAPHLNYTGEIGLIKIISFKKHRGGMRLEILAGQKARANYLACFDQVKELSQILSCPKEQVVKFCQDLQAKLALAQSEKAELEFELLSQEVKAQFGQDLIHLDLDANLDRRQMINLANLAKLEAKLVFLTAPHAKGRFFVLAARDLDAKAILESLKSKFKIFGGGSKEMVDGLIQAESLAQVLDFLAGELG